MQNPWQLGELLSLLEALNGYDLDLGHGGVVVTFTGQMCTAELCGLLQLDPKHAFNWILTPEAVIIII